MSSFLLSPSPPLPPSLIYTHDRHRTTFCNRTTSSSHHDLRPINRATYRSPSDTRSVHLSVSMSMPLSSSSSSSSSLSYLSLVKKQDEFNVSDEIQRLTQTAPVGSEYRRNAYWAAIPMNVLRTEPFFNHLPHPSTLCFSSVPDLVMLRRDCNTFKAALRAALLTPEDVPMLFGLPNASHRHVHARARSTRSSKSNNRSGRRRETVLQAWYRLVQVRHGDQNNKNHDAVDSNKDNNAVDSSNTSSSTSSRNNNSSSNSSSSSSSSSYQPSRRVEFHNRFHQWFSDTHIANAVLVYVHSEQDRWHNICLEDPTTDHLPPHWCHPVQLREVGLIIQPPVHHHHEQQQQQQQTQQVEQHSHHSFFQWSIPLILTPTAFVLRRDAAMFWNWQDDTDVILIHDIVAPFNVSGGRSNNNKATNTRLQLCPPSPTLALNQLLRAQTILDASPPQYAFVHLVAYSPYGGAVVFEINRHHRLCDAIRQYVSNFFRLYVDPVVTPPPSFWRSLKGQDVFDVAEQALESHVRILSIIPPQVAECYLIKARKSMSDWEKSRAEHVFLTHLDDDNNTDDDDDDGN